MVQGLRGDIPLLGVAFALWTSALVRIGGLFSDPSASVLRDPATLWVTCVGQFPLARVCWWSFMVRPRSFQMGFQPLSEASLRALLLAVQFLVFLSAAASLREFTTLSCVLPFVGSDTCLAFVLQFEAQLESLTSSIPRSFLVESLSNFAESLVDGLLRCPARALRLSLHWSRVSSPFASSPLAP